MPVKRRTNKRAARAEFPVSAELGQAFRAYIDSEPAPAISAWPEYWVLADLLDEAGAPVQPLLAGCCCWHPRAGGVPLPGELAVYKRLMEATNAG
jgi:hypothetical protein